jgi:hypothetical protein
MAVEGCRVMTRMLALIEAALLLVGPQASAASPADQLALEMTAVIQMDADHRERGQTVRSLVKCLQDWSPGDGRPPNAVSIQGTGADTFTVHTNLRSPSYFHFRVLRDRGERVAVLVEIEFLRVGKGYQHVVDIETKRAVMKAVCPS